MPTNRISPRFGGAGNEWWPEDGVTTKKFLYVIFMPSVAEILFFVGFFSVFVPDAGPASLPECLSLFVCNTDKKPPVFILCHPW